MTIQVLSARIALITIALTIGILDSTFYSRAYGGAFAVLPLHTNLTTFNGN